MTKPLTPERLAEIKARALKRGRDPEADLEDQENQINLVAEVERLRAERDALQAKLDQVRAWSEERSMLTASGKLVSGVPGLSAILDGKEQDA